MHTDEYGQEKLQTATKTAKCGQPHSSRRTHIGNRDNAYIFFLVLSLWRLQRTLKNSSGLQVQHQKGKLQDLEKKMEDKFEEGVEIGMNSGREEGYTVEKEAFDELVKKMKAREDSKNASTTNSSTQTHPAPVTTPFPCKQTLFSHYQHPIRPLAPKQKPGHLSTSNLVLRVAY